MTRTAHPHMTPLRIGLALFIFVLLLAMAASAEDAESETDGPFKSEAALAAMDTWSKSVDRAEQQFRKSLIAANTVYLRKLEGALKAATRSGDLDEANAIQAEIERIENKTAELESDDEPVEPMQETAATVVTVPARVPWTAVGKVAEGDVLVFEATGEWAPNSDGTRYGPDGLGRRFSLIGRIAGGKPFRIGASKTWTVPANGTLELGMADLRHEDNLGELTVRITRKN